MHRVVLFGAGENVFDFIEVYFFEMSRDNRAEFQKSLNDAALDFGLPWRLADGMMFKVDVEFLQQEIIEPAAKILASSGFEGAQMEFRDARNHLLSGSVRDAITYAAHSVESTLKAALNEQSGVSADLVQKFSNLFITDGIPKSKVKAVSKILSGVAVLRNELGGHGQGREILNIDRSFGELAVNLAAVTNNFLISTYLRSIESSDDPSMDSKDNMTDIKVKLDDIPF